MITFPLALLPSPLNRFKLNGLRTGCLFGALLMLPAIKLHAESFNVTATHDLNAPRSAQVIEVAWTQLKRFIPNPMIDHLRVSLISDGTEIPHQVISYPATTGGVGRHTLLFQHDFTKGEQTANFRVETAEQVVPPYPAKTFARYVPERYDDFAWENDLIAHRAYGPALSAPGDNKEVLVASGFDIWGKRVGYPIINRWYQKEHEGVDYHTDTGEGADFYSVHTTRGTGGTGIWDGSQLHTSGNWTKWRVLANGPIRTVFELSFSTWDAGGPLVSEVKRITVDAGHQLDRIESTFAVTDNSPKVFAAIGIAKHADLSGLFSKDQTGGWMSFWESYPEHGQLGTGIVLASTPVQGFAEDGANHLMLTKLVSNEPIIYYAGAAWAARGDITSAKAWRDYLAAWSDRIQSPVRVTVSADTSQ